MNRISMRDLQKDKSWLENLPAVLTRHGKPVAIIVGVNNNMSEDEIKQGIAGKNNDIKKRS